MDLEHGARRAFAIENIHVKQHPQSQANKHRLSVAKSMGPAGTVDVHAPIPASLYRPLRSLSRMTRPQHRIVFDNGRRKGKHHMYKQPLSILNETLSRAPNSVYKTQYSFPLTMNIRTFACSSRFWWNTCHVSCSPKQLVIVSLHDGKNTATRH